MSPTLGLPCKGEAGLGRTALSAREVERAGVLRRVKEGKLKLVSAAQLLGISTRQAKRLWQRYQEQGIEGLKHRAAGRSSNRAKPEGFRKRVLWLVGDKYRGGIDERFGPTLAAEHLASEDGLEISCWTLRRWMLSEGLWSREPQARTVSQAARAQGTFRRAGAVGWKFSCLARGSRSRRMFDESGGRRHRHHLVPLGEAGNHLGGGQPAATLDRAIRHSSGSVHGLEECLCAASDRSGERGRAGATDAVWTHVCQAGHSHHRRQFATSQRPSGTQSWHASGSTDQEAA